MPDDSFDAVICSAGLLYMVPRRALEEWRRVLVPGGVVGFSTMQVGSPPAGRVFRELATAFEVLLPDSAEPLGDVERSRAELVSAGFVDVVVQKATVSFTPEDLAGAWGAHALSPGIHDQIAVLDPHSRATVRREYEVRIADLAVTAPDELCTAQVLYARGRKPSA